MDKTNLMGVGGFCITQPKFQQVLTVHQIENRAKVPPNKVYPAVYVNINGQ